ncbi:hypothetical protein D3C85_1942840 [compost metagenome]
MIGLSQINTTYRDGLLMKEQRIKAVAFWEVEKISQFTILINGGLQVISALMIMPVEIQNNLLVESHM